MPSIDSVAPWLTPQEGWMGRALATGTGIGSQIGQSFMQGAQLRQQREEMDFRRQQYDDMLPLKIAEEQARKVYQQSQVASNLIKIKELEAEAADKPLFASAIGALNEASKTGGADAILNFKPPTFNFPDNYARFTDLQLKLANGLRQTAEAKQFAMLTNVEKARVADIRNSDASEEAKAIALDEVFAAANARNKKQTPARSATPGSAIYDADGNILHQVPVVETVETVEKFPAVEGVPAKEPGRFFGKGRPAVEAQPEKTVKTKRAVDTKSDFKSADDVKSAVFSGKLKKDEALEILRSQFGYE